MPASRSTLVATLRAAGCVFAEDEAALLSAATDDDTALEALVAARVDGTPLEHVLGWAAFAGRRFRVGPGVFVPRRRSELLVEVARRRLGGPERPVVIDLCCGAGALGLAVTTGRGAELHAVDVDQTAARWARVNVGDAGRVWVGDLFAPLPAGLRGRVDLLLASAPYVPTETIALLPPEAREHEPHRALDGGPDGLDVYRRILAGAPDWLAPTGVLVLESSERQASVLAAAVRAAGLTAEVVTDPADATVVVGAADGPRPASTSRRTSAGSGTAAPARPAASMP